MRKGLQKMIDPEHLRILSQGVKGFKEWREDNLGIDPNLIKANRNGAVLQGANLSGANLKRANLSYTNLSRTDISGANIVGCLVAQKN